MIDRRHGVMRMGVLVAALAVSGALADPAQAGTYRVAVCSQSEAKDNVAFVGSTSGTGYTATDECGSVAPRLRQTTNGSSASPGATALWSFTAPPGTTLRTADYSVSGYRDQHNGVATYLETDLALLEGCRFDNDTACPFSSGYGAEKTNVALGGAQYLRLVTTCIRGEGCAPARTDHLLRGASIEVEDTSPPELTRRGGTLEESPVQHGTASYGFSAADNVGIRSARLLVDGDERARKDFECEQSRPVPCRSQDDQSLSFDTRELKGGQHSARLIVADAAGNESTQERSFTVENRLGSLGVAFRASKRRVRNGKRLMFLGRVADGELPAARILVALQAKVGRKWVTFRTVRTDERGLFGARYRFTRTFRTRTYSFRARVSAQAGVEADSNSRRVRVRVRGG